MAELEEILEIKVEALRNLERADNFLRMYDELRKQEGASSGRNSIVTSDALRAAIVFQHAAVEDFIRLHFRRMIVQGRQVDGVGNVSLVEAIDFLSQLPDTNPDILNMSHNDYVRLQGAELFLRKTTFTNASSIRTSAMVVTGLKGVKLMQQTALDDSLFETLGKQAMRRNQIVHRCDRSHEYMGKGHTGKGKSRIRPLRLPFVESCRAATECFVEAITDLLVKQLP